ncbi:MAG TPA: fatty acyl-AMP ligase [Caulobacteraceae bacterium]|nr:fatty acyl-AMP ligase [Caulobacteraceae bacterium]
MPTPTAPGRSIRRSDFSTLAGALDFAAGQETGVNIHSLRGELVEVLPYSQLREQALALAGRLLAAGLVPGDRVMMAAESDGDFLRGFFACQYAGLAPAPCPLPAPFGGKAAYVDHLRRMLISAEVRAAFAPPAIAEWFSEAAEGLGIVRVGGLADLPATAESRLPAPDANGLSYLQFSSGSTRFPTGVAVTQRALMANLRAIGEALSLRPDDRAVSWLPLYHDMGLVGMLLCALSYQVSLDLVPTGAFVRRPTLWLDLISQRRGTVSYAPTFGFDLATRRVGAMSPELDLGCWRVAGLGGDMIRPEPLRNFAAAFAGAGFDPGAFTASYGMAEATLALSLTPIGQGLRTDPVDMDGLERDGVAESPRAGSRRIREFALCGAALEGHQIEARDDAGRVLAERRVGRIFARGPSLMQAYFGAPDETAKVLSDDGWLDTGDLGYALDGQIVITGRAKDLIIVNGRNLWPQDLEWTAEREIESLRSGDVAVFSIDPEGDAERIVALVQCRSSDPVVRDALSSQVAALLRTRHGVEIEVAPVPPHSLPQTSSGKLSRSKARALFLEGAFRPVLAETSA